MRNDANECLPGWAPIASWAVRHPLRHSCPRLFWPSLQTLTNIASVILPAIVSSSLRSLLPSITCHLPSTPVVAVAWHLSMERKKESRFRKRFKDITDRFRGQSQSRGRNQPDQNQSDQNQSDQNQSDQSQSNQNQPDQSQPDTPPGKLQETSSDIFIQSPGRQCSPPESVAQAQRPTVDEPQSDTTLTVQKTTPHPPDPSSQQVWNDAFNRIEDDRENAELFQAYIKVLNDTLGSSSDEGDGGTVGDIGAEPRSAATRQRQMARLVKEGQAKIRKSSKITKAVGDFVEAVLVLKPVGDLVIKNAPQALPAALPWAGVCAALQVSAHLISCIALAKPAC